MQKRRSSDVLTDFEGLGWSFKARIGGADLFYSAFKTTMT